MGYEYSTNIRSPFNFAAQDHTFGSPVKLNHIYNAQAKKPLEKITPPKVYAATQVKPVAFERPDLTKPVSQGLIEKNRFLAAGHKQDVLQAKGNLKKVQTEAKAQIVEAMKVAAASMPEINNKAVNTFTAAPSSTSDAASLAVDYADPTHGGAGFVHSLVMEATGRNLSSTQVQNLLNKTCDVLKEGMPQERYLMQETEQVGMFDWSDVTADDLQSILSGKSPEMAALEQEEANIKAIESDCNLADISNSRYLMSGTPEEIRQILGTTDIPELRLNNKMKLRKLDPDMDDETVHLTGASLSSNIGNLAGLNKTSMVPQDIALIVRPTSPQTQSVPNKNGAYTYTVS